MAFWLLLSGHYDLADPSSRYLIACGFATCVFVTWLARRRFRILDDEGHPIQLLPRAFYYGPWLFWQIILSNWDVFRRVWSPRLRISPELVRVPDGTRSALGSVIYANSITLTPGTVTIGIDPAKRELLVHCLHAGAVEDLLAGGMLEQVKRFEGLGR
jgi:multicomponent Na+:H+ antiporter subunit E